MEHSFEEQINIASLFLQENNLEQSIQNYEYALKSASTIKQKMDLYILLGRLYQKNNESSKAIDNLKKAIKTYDDFLEKDTLIDKASIFNNLATLYLVANIDLAIDNYKLALKYNPKSIEYYLHIASVYDQELKKNKAALEYYKKFISSLPEKLDSKKGKERYAINLKKYALRRITSIKEEEFFGVSEK